MAMSEHKLKNLLELAFPDSTILVEDLAGDGEHYGVEITSKVFKDLSILEQHRLVYSALSGYDLHAIRIKTIAES